MLLSGHCTAGCHLVVGKVACQWQRQQAAVGAAIGLVMHGPRHVEVPELTSFIFSMQALAAEVTSPLRGAHMHRFVVNANPPEAVGREAGVELEGALLGEGLHSAVDGALVWVHPVGTLLHFLQQQAMKGEQDDKPAAVCPCRCRSQHATALECSKLEHCHMAQSLNKLASDMRGVQPCAPASVVPATVCTECCCAIRQGKLPMLKAASGRQK